MALDDTPRKAFAIMFGEMQGRTWDWDEMAYKDQR